MYILFEEHLYGNHLMEKILKGIFVPHVNKKVNLH
jgi:hypothetical protein